MANRELKDRGSRRHVLDLVESPHFKKATNGIIARSGFQLATPSHHQPSGRQNADCWCEFEIEEYFADDARQFANLPVIKSDSWLTYRSAANRCPTWDLIAHLQSVKDDRQSGILLAEAKANIGELKIKDAKSKPTVSEKSKHNDAQIKRRIHEARISLNRLGCGSFYISDADHYQLANRLTYSVHLANQGYRVVLLYLGFTGDTYFADPITDEHHWQRVVGGYLQGVVPQTFPEHEHPMANGGSIRMLIQSQPIMEASK
jgi:hypothetical protein